VSDPTFETLIGVEVHVQLSTVTKLFCRCRAVYGAAPNTHVCPVCLGLPGALPVPNDRAVELALRAAAALRCRVSGRSRFVRKHYFYPDLPKGYQITQGRRPLALEGRLSVRRDREVREIGIRRLHLEEDAGRSLHDRVPGATAVDFNRAGIPLVEIVSEPELRSPAEARDFLRRLRQVLGPYAAVSDCSLEEGSLRVDANVSVRRQGMRDPGTRTEVKNLNSFRNVMDALIFERERQIRRLEEGGRVRRETRRYDAAAGVTRAMRVKEDVSDYRFLPEPDLPPLEVPPDRVEAVRRSLPELPGAVEARLVREHGLSLETAANLAARPERAAYLEAVLDSSDARSDEETRARALEAANLIMGPLAEVRNRREGRATERDLVRPAALRRVVDLRRHGVLSSNTADRAVRLLAETHGADVDALVEEHGLVQVRDTARLERWIEEAVSSHPEEAARYAGGEERLLGFFMGRVMRLAGGGADPEKAKALLRKRLSRVAAEE